VQISALRLRYGCALLSVCALTGLLGAQTGTTILTFDIVGTSSVVPQDYGDFVTAASQANYSYGGTAPYTPDVSVSYAATTGQFYVWPTGYGDLVNATFSGSGLPTATITLAATNGAGVSLTGFDLGGWTGVTPQTVPAVNVRDGAGALVFQQTNVIVPNAPSSHLHVGFSPPLQGLTLTIELVVPPSGLNFVAIDNVTFGEFSPNGVGQANSPQAALRINGVGTTGLQGPFAVAAQMGGTLSFSWNGPPGAALLLFGGPLNPHNQVIPCVGIVDVATPPFYPNLVIYVDGNQPSFPDSLFHLTPAGTATQSFSLPAPASLTFQGAVFQAAGSPCPLVLTAAFGVTIT
jgi:hypothetical protein